VEQPWPEVHVIFLRTSGIFAAITRWVTRSPVNHMYIDIPVWGRRMVCEAATDGGVRLVPSVMHRNAKVVMAYRCHFDTAPGLYAVAALLGRPYDYWGSFGIAAVLLAWRWFRLRFRHFSWSTKAVKCSELAVLFFKACKIGEVSMDPEMVAPSDVLSWCNKRPGYFAALPGSERGLAGWEGRS